MKTFMDIAKELSNETETKATESAWESFKDEYQTRTAHFLDKNV